MAVDNNPASPYYGSLYVVWTNFSRRQDLVHRLRPTAGTTWSATQGISSSSSSVQGAWPAVAPTARST